MQKLQQCWAFESALPPIHFVLKSEDPVAMAILKEKRLRRPSEAQPEDTDAVYCDVCGQLWKWKLSKGMVSIICPLCTIGLAKQPRQKKIKSRGFYAAQEENSRAN